VLSVNVDVPAISLVLFRGCTRLDCEQAVIPMLIFVAIFRDVVVSFWVGFSLACATAGTRFLKIYFYLYLFILGTQ
jgi:hypothetical protein